MSNTPESLDNTLDDLDLGALDAMDIDTPDIEYQKADDSGCEGGACKI